MSQRRRPGPDERLRPGRVDQARLRHGSNRCRISAHSDERTGRLIVFAAIDNLWKGTSSQAIQNLNLMFGRPEDEGLGA